MPRPDLGVVGFLPWPSMVGGDCFAYKAIAHDEAGIQEGRDNMKLPMPWWKSRRPSQRLQSALVMPATTPRKDATTLIKQGLHR